MSPPRQTLPLTTAARLLRMGHEGGTAGAAAARGAGAAVGALAAEDGGEVEVFVEASEGSVVFDDLITVRVSSFA